MEGAKRALKSTASSANAKGDWAQHKGKLGFVRCHNTAIIYGFSAKCCSSGKTRRRGEMRIYWHRHQRRPPARHSQWPLCDVLMGTGSYSCAHFALAAHPQSAIEPFTGVLSSRMFKCSSREQCQKVALSCDWAHHPERRSTLVVVSWRASGEDQIGHETRKLPVNRSNNSNEENKFAYTLAATGKEAP